MYMIIYMCVCVIAYMCAYVCDCVCTCVQLCVHAYAHIHVHPRYSSGSKASLFCFIKSYFISDANNNEKRFCGKSFAGTFKYFENRLRCFPLEMESITQCVMFPLLRKEIAMALILGLLFFLLKKTDFSVKSNSY